MAIGFFGNSPEAATRKQITDKLNFINEKYTDIGRYVKLNLADKVEDEQIKELLREIDATLVELKGLNEQLNTLRGVKLCTSCGKEIPIGTLFCPVCGQKQPALQPSVPQPQPNVQYQQPTPMPAPTFNNQPAPMAEMASPAQTVPMPQAEFSFDHAPAQPQQDNSQGVIPEKAAEQPQAEQHFLYCSQCGNKQSAEKKFCSQCGAPML